MVVTIIITAVYLPCILCGPLCSYSIAMLTLKPQLYTYVYITGMAVNNFNNIKDNDIADYSMTFWEL